MISDVDQISAPRRRTGALHTQLDLLTTKAAQEQLETKSQANESIL
jgi:hypothetical protein